MNPTTARNVAAAFGLFDLLSALIYPLPATALAAVTLVAALVLAYVYWRQRRSFRAAGGARPSAPQRTLPEGILTDDSMSRWPDRNPADTRVLRTTLATLAAMVLAATVQTVGAPLGWVPYPAALWGMIFPVAFALAATYITTLIDWYIVLPRLAGLVCDPPCRSAPTRAWLTVTRLVQIHRYWAAIVWLVSIAGLVGSAAFLGLTVYLKANNSSASNSDPSPTSAFMTQIGETRWSQGGIFVTLGRGNAWGRAIAAVGQNMVDVR